MNATEFLTQFSQLGFEYDHTTGGTIDPDVNKIKSNGYVLTKNNIYNN